MKTIAVIGSGTMGSGIAQVFAQHHYQVQLIDSNTLALDKALKTIEQSLSIQVSKGLISSSDREACLQHLELKERIDEHLSDVDLFIEAITENEAAKKNVFEQIDRVAKKEAIIASNTSSISISHLAKATRRPEKVIGMHFMNPVPRMNLVEVITGDSTSIEVTEAIVETTKSLGKTPVVVRDFPGFVANRILMPMINEAVACLADQVADAHSIDLIMKLGMAHPMGPLQLADLIGLDVCVLILEVLYQGLKEEKYKPHPLLVKFVSQGNLGKKTGSGFYSYIDPKNPTPNPI